MIGIRRPTSSGGASQQQLQQIYDQISSVQNQVSQVQAQIPATTKGLLDVGQQTPTANQVLAWHAGTSTPGTDYFAQSPNAPTFPFQIHVGDAIQLQLDSNNYTFVAGADYSLDPSVFPRPTFYVTGDPDAPQLSLNPVGPGNLSMYLEHAGDFFPYVQLTVNGGTPNGIAQALGYYPGYNHVNAPLVTPGQYRPTNLADLEGGG